MSTVYISGSRLQAADHPKLEEKVVEDSRKKREPPARLETETHLVTIQRIENMPGRGPWVRDSYCFAVMKDEIALDIQ